MTVVVHPCCDPACSGNPCENAPRLGGVTLSDDQARELSRVSKQIRSFTERRNRMIRECFEQGAGIREIARATGLNVGTVHTMLHGRKR